MVKAGESWIAPMGAIHNVSESTSTTEPATGFAVMLVPKGAALATPVAAPHARIDRVLKSLARVLIKRACALTTQVDRVRLRQSVPV